MSTQKTIYFKELDLLRFTAAFIIMLYHIVVHYDIPPMFKTLTHNMVLSVDLFFIISGFLITFFLIEEKQITKTIHIQNFYIKRILRIFPLYYFTILGAFILYDLSFSELISYAFFVGNFHTIENGHFSAIPFFVPLWSLCIEEQFYLLIPFLLWLTPLRKVPYLLIALIIISIIYRAGIVLKSQNIELSLYCNTISRFDVLLIGAFMGYWHSVYDFRVSISKTRFVIVLASVFLIVFWVDSSSVNSAFQAMFKKYLFILPITILFLSIVLNKAPKSALLNWLTDNYTLSYLGKISFGIYMYQFPISTYIRQSPFLTQSFPIYSIAVILSTIIIATISYELFEKRFTKLKDRYL